MKIFFLEKPRFIPIYPYFADSEICTDNKADVIYTGLQYYIGRNLMDRYKNLKIIVTPTTGLTHIDLDYAKRRGIDVISLKGETEFLEDIHSTAEHTIALTLSLLRKIPHAFSKVSEWNRDDFIGSELYGKTIGIIGVGRLGKLPAPVIYNTISMQQRGIYEKDCLDR